MKKKWILVFFMIHILCILNCTHFRQFVRTGDFFPALSENAFVKVILTGKNAPAYREIGIVRITLHSDRLDVAVEEAKIAARKNGGDCIIYLTTRVDTSYFVSGSYGGTSKHFIFDFVVGKLEKWQNSKFLNDSY